MQPFDRLFVLYTPGVDFRRLTKKDAPYTSSLMSSFPCRTVRSIPSSELLSTTITGMWPHHHGIWQAKRKPVERLSFSERLSDLLPDFLTTTAQCAYHMVTGNCDMATMPPRRRRELEFTRIKFHGPKNSEALLSKLQALGNPVSILSVLGKERSRYFFTDRFNDRQKVLEMAGTGEAPVNLIQFHDMDILGHWHLDTEEKFSYFYQSLDEFIKRFHQKCLAQKATLVLV